MRSILENTIIEKSADSSLTSLADFIEKHGFDSSLGIRLTSLLQLSDDEIRFSTYDLSDIGLLFDALMHVDPDKIDYCLEAAYFFDTVMGDQTKGRKLAVKAKMLLEKKQLEVMDLIATLDDRVSQESV